MRWGGQLLSLNIQAMQSYPGNAILSDDGTPELAPAYGNAVYETDIVIKVWLV